MENWQEAFAKLEAEHQQKLHEKGAYRMEAARDFVAYLKYRGDVIEAEVWSWGVCRCPIYAPTEKALLDKLYGL